MVHMPGDAPYCTPEQYKECADPALDFLVERDNDYCVCETPCNLTRYGKEMSFVKIPSKASAKYLAKKFNKTEQYIAENILVLDIYFEALNYETIEQKKAYELAGLLGDIGGQMGLFIGASILTILELFDYLYEVIKFRLCRCVKKKHKGRNNNDRGAVLSLDDVKRHAPCENMRTPSSYPGNMLPHHPAQGNFEDFTCWAAKPQVRVMQPKPTIPWLYHIYLTQECDEQRNKALLKRDARRIDKSLRNLESKTKSEKKS